MSLPIFWWRFGLLRPHGWRLDALRAFHAFPMTHHVECLATLERSNA